MGKKKKEPAKVTPTRSRHVSSYAWMPKTSKTSKRKLCGPDHTSVWKSCVICTRRVRVRQLDNRVVWHRRDASFKGKWCGGSARVQE